MRLKTKIFFLLLMSVYLHTGQAFTPLGPFKDWQTAALGYRYQGQIGGPMIPFEAYRWNVPVITYAFDSTFIRYFGTNGMYEVERAIKLLQDVPPVDQIVGITNFNDPFGPPTFDLIVTNNGLPEIVAKTPYGFNQTAADLGLHDLKSYALSMLVEELGLMDPVNSVWNLRARTTPVPGVTNYGVFIGNYDPVTLLPSSFVNDIPWGYTIFDPTIPGVADTIENLLGFDPLNNAPVASGYLSPGYFYERLTYDDVGGLRFLYSTNRLVVETLINSGSSVIQRAAGLLGGTSPWTIVFGSTNISTNGLILTNINANLSNVVNAAIRPGVGKLNFYRVEYDSLIGQTFVAITNFYTDRYISNSTVVLQPLQRIILQPDILFTAEDLGVIGVLPAFTARSGTANWSNNSLLNSHGGANVYGPGIINPQIVIRFTDLLPYYFNSNPAFLDDVPTDATHLPEGAWGSYDSSTNAPVVYPIFMNFDLQTIRTVLTNKTTIIRSK